MKCQLVMLCAAAAMETSRLAMLLKSTRSARLYSARSKTEAIDDASRVIATLTYPPALANKITFCLSLIYTIKISVMKAFRALPRVSGTFKTWRRSLMSLIVSFEEVLAKLVSNGMLDADSISTFNRDVTKMKSRLRRVDTRDVPRVARSRVFGVEIVILTDTLDEMLSHVWVNLVEQVKEAGGTAKETVAALLAFRALRYWDDTVRSLRYALRQEVQFHSSIKQILKSTRNSEGVIREYANREIAWYCHEMHSQIADFYDSLVNACMAHCYEWCLSTNDTVNPGLRRAERLHTQLSKDTVVARERLSDLSDALRECMDSLGWYNRPTDSRHLGKFEKLSVEYIKAQEEYSSLRSRTGDELGKIIHQISQIVMRDE